MSSFKQSLSNNREDRARVFEQAIIDVFEALQPFVEQVERRAPGHNFGRRTMNHMVGLQADAEQLGRDQGLTLQEMQILGICLGVHDIGRVVCEAERPGDRAYQHDHGSVGAKFLRDGCLLSMLDPGVAQVILDAVEQHSAKDVTLAKGSLAHTVCYILRDLDKLELFGRTEAFLSPEGALTQIDLWMLSDEGKARLRDADFATRAALHKVMLPVLHGERVPESIDNLPLLTREVLQHLTRPIPRNIIAEVQNGGLLFKAQMITGYPAYMFAQVSYANDLETRTVRARTIQQRLLEPRNRYLMLVAPEATLAIQAVFNRLSLPG